MKNITHKYPFFMWVVYIYLYLPALTLQEGSSKVINGKYTENIQNYHLAVPHKATVDGEFSSFHLPHFHEHDPTLFKKRKKRELIDPDMVNYGLYVDDELHHIELWPNRDFIHPHLLIERRDPTLPVHKRDVKGIDSLKKMCYYTGRVRGVKPSRAAISTCDGLAGSIRIGNKIYFIEPVQEHSPNANGHHLHVVYTNHPYSTKNYCAVKSSPENWKRSIEERLRQDFIHEKILFKKSAETYEVVPQWIQMMVTGDKQFINKHKGKRDVLQWILTIFNMVRDFYADETMTAYITPVVIRIILLEKEEKEINLDIGWDIDKTLKSFCAWSLKLQQPNGTVHHFDTSLLLTEWDFCHDNPTGGEKDCGVQGIGMVGQACGNMPCQLNEDRGFMTGVTVSHEQGHLLGMDHDQYPPRCPPNDTEGWYVMAPSGEALTVTWSPCSTAAMRELARNHFLDCLNDEPPATDYTIPDGMPGVTSNIGEQCNFYQPDQNYTDTCNEESCRPMYCARDEKCFMIDAQVADGTRCGENKWCFRSQCTEKGNRPQSVDGAWGEWTEWTPCSRTCGKGIQRRQRFCDNPKPANKGKYCLGERSSFKICIIEDCPEDQSSFREQQCRSKFNPADWSVNLTLDGLNYPVIKPDKPCDIFCLFKYMKKGVEKTTTINVGKADDGTICVPGVPNKICIVGLCKEVGCDGKLESTSVEDRCGICNGDGTMCKVTNTIWNSPVSVTSTIYGPSDYPKIVEIPAGAKKIEISENSPSPNIIAIGTPDGKTDWYMNGNFKLEHGGTKLMGKKKNMWGYYSGNDGTKETFTLDRAREDLGVFLGMTEADHVNYTYKWIENSDEPTYEPKYAWDTDEFKDCNAECGGGTQLPMFHCTEEKAGKVSNKFCEKLDQPSGEPRKCNEKPCAIEWKVGTWGRCRACKKKGGVRVRVVECVKKSSKTGADDIIQEDSECKAPKPGTVELCETLKTCGSRRKRTYHIPGKYQETIWQQMKKLHLVKREAGPTFATVKKTFQRMSTIKTSISTRHTQSPYTGTVHLPKKQMVIDKEAEIKVVQVEKKVVEAGNLSELDQKMGAKPGTKIVLGTTKQIPDFMDKVKCKALKVNRAKKLNRSKMLNLTSKTVKHRISTTTPLP